MAKGMPPFMPESLEKLSLLSHHLQVPASNQHAHRHERCAVEESRAFWCKRLEGGE